MAMDMKTKHSLGMAMGVVILLLDLYWLWIAWGNSVPQILGILILIATLIWLWADM